MSPGGASPPGTRRRQDRALPPVAQRFMAERDRVHITGANAPHAAVLTRHDTVTGVIRHADTAPRRPTEDRSRNPTAPPPTHIPYLEPPPHGPSGRSVRVV